MLEIPSFYHSTNANSFCVAAGGLVSATAHDFNLMHARSSIPQFRLQQSHAELLVSYCRALSEVDQSLDSTQMMGEDDYGPGLQRRSSRQRRAREWGDDMAADWTGHKGSQSDDYSDEGEA